MSDLDEIDVAYLVETLHLTADEMESPSLVGQPGDVPTTRLVIPSPRLLRDAADTINALLARIGGFPLETPNEE